jgi:hypothetical protein
VREAHEACAGHNGVYQGIYVQHPTAVCRREAQGHVPLVPQAVERPQDRVVVPIRCHHAPAIAHRAQDSHVERLGGVGGKDQPLRMAKAEKGRDPLPRKGDGAGRGKLGLVGSTAARAKGAQGVCDGVNHALGTLVRRGGTVEVNHGAGLVATGW